MEPKVEGWSWRLEDGAPGSNRLELGIEGWRGRLEGEVTALTGTTYHKEVAITTAG